MNEVNENGLNEIDLKQVSGGAKATYSKGPMEMQDVEDKLKRKFSNAFIRHHLEKQFDIVLYDLQNSATPFDTAIKHCQEFALSDTRNDKLYFRLWDELILLRAAYHEA